MEIVVVVMYGEEGMGKGKEFEFDTGGGCSVGGSEVSRFRRR
jgi:hypothetical protein